MNDLRFAFRQLLKNPGFTAVAVITLGLGIGACVSIFSVAQAMFLRDRPYRDPARLLWVWQRDQTKPGSWLHVSPPNFIDWRQQTQSFDQLAAFAQFSPDLENTGAGAVPAERVRAGAVTVNLLSILGVQPLLGRAFLPDDEQSRVVVLSHALWQTRFHSDPNVLHQTVRLNGVDYTVIGVMPQRFHFPPMPKPDQLWMPLALDGKRLTEAERGHRHWYVLGRLRPEATMKSAQLEMDTVMERLARAHPEANRNQGAALHHLKDFWHHPFERIIYVLLGAVGLLVLMACFNVANLLLARATARQQEMALRTALGARRPHLLRQLLLESLLLAALGGVAGLALALGGTHLLAATIPLHNYRVGEIEIDAPVLVFAMALSLLTGLLFGLAPALTTAKVDLFAALKEGSRHGEGRRPRRWRNALVVGQVALAVVLLTGALVTAQKFFEMRRADWGFQPERLLTARVPLPEFRYTNSARFINFDTRLRTVLGALPGVEAVATSTDLPVAGDGGLDREFQVEGRPAAGPPGRGPIASLQGISPRYFQTLGVRLLNGRDFSNSEFATGASVAIISRALGQQQFAGEDPIGKRLRIFAPADGKVDREKERVLEIVGVAGDARNYADQEPFPAIYIPYAQKPSSDLSLVIRTVLEPDQMAPMIRGAVAELDPQLPVVSLRTMTEHIRNSMADERLQVVLWTLFAGAAMGLATIGLYGVLSFSVALRTRDLAIQVALGASRRKVMGQVMAGGLRLTLAGLAMGLALSWVGWRLVSSQLYVGRAPEPLVLASVAGSLIGVAALACFVPARRATKVDPMEALRHE